MEVRYDGFTRVVEVRAVGYSEADNLVARVWQVRGGSTSGERVGWKMLRLDEASSGVVLNEASEAPRHGYRRNDRDMTTIVCQI